MPEDVDFVLVFLLSTVQLDSLQNPCADLGMDVPSMLHYKYHPEKEVSIRLLLQNIYCSIGYVYFIFFEWMPAFSPLIYLNYAMCTVHAIVIKIIYSNELLILI